MAIGADNTADRACARTTGTCDLSEYMRHRQLWAMGGIQTLPRPEGRGGQVGVSVPKSFQHTEVFVKPSDCEVQ